MENLYDVIIIGSGPAGLSAAIYAKRAKLSSLTIEANFASGGQVLNSYEVDNYPGLPGISGMDLGSTLRAHAEKMGAEFSRERVKELVLAGLLLAYRDIVGGLDWVAHVEEKELID